MNVASRLKKKANEAKERLEDNPEAQEARKKLDAYDARKKWVHDLFEDPGHSWAAFCVVGFVIFCIFTSTVAFCVETLPIMETTEHRRTFWILEIFFVSVFTLEYAL